MPCAASGRFYVDGQWRTAELTKKEAALLTAIGVDIT